MPMNRQAKESAVEDLSDKLSRAKSALVASFQGLTVADVHEIRGAFRAIGVEYKVVKNTLMKRALTGRSIEALGAAFVGPTAVVLKFDDEAGRLGKVAKELTKKFEKLQIKAGFVEDDVLTGASVVDTMAALPTLDEARAQLLGLFNAPAAKLLAQINAPGSNLVGVVQAKKQKDEKGEAA